MTRPLAILKLGSSVLPDESALPVAVGEIRRHLARGQVVLAVVSALGGGTDELVARARRVAPDPDPAALAALLATGESTATALLGMALDAAGLPATVLDPGHVGPLTHGPLLDARPYELSRSGIRRALEARPVAVLPGFVGRTDDGRTSLLGRGGSDLSALFAAHALEAAECRLLKDVDGVYERDPRDSDTISGGRDTISGGRDTGSRGCETTCGGHDSTPGTPSAPPRRYAELSFRDAVDLGDRVVQPKAARFALRHGVPFEVAAPGGGRGTRVGAASSVLEASGAASTAASTAASGAASTAGSAASGSPAGGRASKERLAWA